MQQTALRFVPEGGRVAAERACVGRAEHAAWSHDPRVSGNAPGRVRLLAFGGETHGAPRP